ncbi:hypothetical protein XANMN_08830 [Xanthomonas phaseoli pv. manihotis str. CIO151]|nr:hypothetical protein XANMN_08830 [Xanthomonas phaseoli pv. manihotis str. CIO151]
MLRRSRGCVGRQRVQPWQPAGRPHRQASQAVAAGRPGWSRVARRDAFAYTDAIAAGAVVSSADLGHHRVPV